MNCPACRSATTEQRFDGVNGTRVLLDACHTCHGLWFDARESLQLSANGVLRLFREMQGRRDKHHRLKEPLACPRCRAELKRTNDLARGNRFQYFRCHNGHGHFITFFQFLREKGIVRGLNPKELTELKKHVQAIQCSDCESPILLASDPACPACHAPVCILDPKALGSTVGDLKQAAAVAGAVVAPALAAQLLMDKMKMDGFYRKLDAYAHSARAPVNGSQAEGANHVEAVVDGVELGAELADGTGVDLIEMGVEFFFDVIGSIDF